MLSYLAPILVFGILIFVHELGHFLAAKAMGVYAPRFSIGFGPALLRFRRGETEYILAALPLGGYVRMASRLDEESAFLEGGSEEKAETPTEWEDPNAMIPFGPKPVPADRWFESKPLPARILIMIAGVSMNAILAFVIYSGLILHAGREILPTTVIGNVPSIAADPQLQRLRIGDTIRAINGRAVSSWNDVAREVSGSTGVVVFQTSHDTVTVPLTAGLNGSDLFAGMDYYAAAVIDSVLPGQPAVAAGFQRGDSVIAIEGEAIHSWTDLTRHVGAAAGRPLGFQVARADGIHSITVTPVGTEVPDPVTGGVDTVGKIGAARRSIASLHAPVSLVEGLGDGATMTWGMAGQIVHLVGGLFTGRQSVKQLGGPIAITRLSVASAKGGFTVLLELIAGLSVSLAILNLLPVPVLDGGQILINILESAKGSPFSLRTREYILRVGLVAIGLLFVTVMYNDTKVWLVQLFTWVAKSVGHA